MTPELQIILNLLSGSAACCKEKGGDGLVGDHVVSVTHPDGRVTSVTVPDKFSPGQETWFKWRKFSESGLNLNTCAFNDLRKEATRILKAFVADPIPYVSADHIQCPLVPDFWRVKLDVSEMNVSRTGIKMAHGKVRFITLQDVLPWNSVCPFKENIGHKVKLSVKTPFKAFLQLIIEAASSLSQCAKVGSSV